MEIRVDIHSHTDLDPEDGPSHHNAVKYSFQDAIAAAKRAGIDVLSFTHHNKLIFTDSMRREAKRQGILLLPGFEATIEGAHVVIINPTTDRIRTFEQLAAERARNPQVFVLAPHPFYPGAKCLAHRLIRHIELFDAIEYCHLHTAWFNVPNWIAAWVARRYNKTLMGTSDSHKIVGFGMTYSVIPAAYVAAMMRKRTNISSLSAIEIINALRKPEHVQVYSPVVPWPYLRDFLGQSARHVRFMLGIK